jgi:hypothetical protein
MAAAIAAKGDTAATVATIAPNATTAFAAIAATAAGSAINAKFTTLVHAATTVALATCLATTVNYRRKMFQ